MGSACCVAARQPIVKGSPSEPSQRHSRRSPSWSFRWDNRVRVAGEELSEDWVHDGGTVNDHLDIKYGLIVGIASPSEGASPFESLVDQKSTISQGNSGILRHPSSDPSVFRALAGKHSERVEPTETLSVSYPSPAKPSPSAPSVPSLSKSSLSSQSHQLPAVSTPLRWHHRSLGHRRLHASGSRIPEYKSSTFSISEEACSSVLPSWGSTDGSSDSWPSPAFSELRTTSKERWSFDSQQISRSPSFDLQTCGVCVKPLTERSSWGSQKLFATTETDVVAVLICGHVFHAECLERMTPEINKYDPICPVCTLGDRISKKAVKAEMDLKARKLSRNCVIDSNLIKFDHDKSSPEGTGPRISSSSSMKSNSKNHFLRRHFSFGSKGNRSLSENRKRGISWAKSSKE